MKKILKIKKTLRRSKKKQDTIYEFSISPWIAILIIGVLFIFLLQLAHNIDTLEIPISLFTIST